MAEFFVRALNIATIAICVLGVGVVLGWLISERLKRKGK